MNFAPFTPFTPTATLPAALQPSNPRAQVATGGGSVESLVKQLGPTAKKLHSDYLNMSIYYYIPDTNAIVEIETTEKLMRKPNSNVEFHIRELNGLPRA
jgi:hypothetical protein